MLASMEQVSLAVSVISILINVVLAVSVVVLGNKLSEISKLKERVEKAAGELVDLKLRETTAKFDAAIGEIRFRVASIEQRLLTGHDHMNKLDAGLIAAQQRDHQLQVEVLKAISELKDAVATKEDLARLREELRA